MPKAFGSGEKAQGDYGEASETPQTVAEMYAALVAGEAQAADMERALDRIEAQIAAMEATLSSCSSNGN